MALLTASALSDAVDAPPGDAALIERLTLAADRAVRRFLGQDFTAGPFTEDHPGGGRLLFLEHYPVATVASVTVAGVEQPTTSYRVHAERGVVESLDAVFGPTRPRWAVRVVYTATTAVPDTVKQAALMLAEHWYREAKTHAATGQLNVGTAADGTSYPWAQASGYRLPPAVLQTAETGADAGGVRAGKAGWCRWRLWGKVFLLGIIPQPPSPGDRCGNKQRPTSSTPATGGGRRSTRPS